jgi:dihydrofolate reductase
VRAQDKQFVYRRIAGENLIDEYRLMIYPVVLGMGKRFFRDGNGKTTLTLKQVETASTGVTMLPCKPAPDTPR